MRNDRVARGRWNVLAGDCLSTSLPLVPPSPSLSLSLSLSLDPPSFPVLRAFARSPAAEAAGNRNKQSPLENGEPDSAHINTRPALSRRIVAVQHICMRRPRSRRRAAGHTRDKRKRANKTRDAAHNHRRPFATLLVVASLVIPRAASSRNVASVKYIASRWK